MSYNNCMDQEPEQFSFIRLILVPVSKLAGLFIGIVYCLMEKAEPGSFNRMWEASGGWVFVLFYGVAGVCVAIFYFYLFRWLVKFLK